MAVVRIVTDSAASLSADVAARYNITIVPLHVQFGMESFAEGVTITPAEFYRRMEQNELPTTSLPAPGAVAEIYRRLKAEADQIISVHVMGRASGTLGTAALAVSLCPDQDISIFDSETLSLGEGLLALLAAQAAAMGKAREEILAQLQEARERVHVFAALPSVSHLVRGGRVTRGQGVLASMLAIKPILNLSGGAVEVIDRVRTFPRALDRVVQLMEQAVGQRRVRLGVVHTNAREQAEAWLESIRERFNVVDTIVADAGLVLAAQVGLGVLGLAALEE